MSVKGKRALIAAWLPRIVQIIIYAIPAIVTILFYAFRSDPSAMDWAATRISAPIRGILGLINSVYPFSLMEFLCAVAGVWLIYYIIRTIVVTVRTREKLKTLSRRLLTLAVAVLYVWCLFCWLWNSGYHAPGFAEKNGLKGGGGRVEDLTAVTSLFADKANEFAPLVPRDGDYHFTMDYRDFIDDSTFIYNNLSKEYPSLSGRLFKPKPMAFSWLMSRTGYTGIYFALTGESNINTRAPACLLPATMAHELAHQRGVVAEDEANFVGILACVTSGYTVYEYSGYLMGLIYLRNALFTADYDAWASISDNLCPEVKKDLQDNYDYWLSQKTVDTGVDFFDNILTTVTGTVSDAVETIYDGYLKTQNQELGIMSYGACVNLLVEYYCS